MTDVISSQQFNTPGSLFGPDFSPTVRRFLTPLPSFDIPYQNRPRRTDQPDSATIQQEREPLPERYEVVGNFSALRATQVLGQHRRQFWGNRGAMTLLSVSDKPALTATAKAQLIADFKLFNDLPAALTPSDAVLSDLSDPPKQATVQLDSLGRLGLAVEEEQLAEENDEAGTSEIPDVPPAPFAANTTNRCIEQIQGGA